MRFAKPNWYLQVRSECNECFRPIIIGIDGIPTSIRKFNIVNTDEYALYKEIKYTMIKSLCDTCYHELGGG